MFKVFKDNLISIRKFYQGMEAVAKACVPGSAAGGFWDKAFSDGGMVPQEDPVPARRHYYTFKPLWIPITESYPEPDKGFLVKTKYDYLIIRRGFREADTIKRWFDMDKQKVAWCYLKDGEDAKA